MQKPWGSMQAKGALLFLAASLADSGFGAPSTEVGRRDSLDPAVMRIEEWDFLGNQLAGTVEIMSADSRQVALSEMLGGPLILLLSYFDCSGSCPTMNRELIRVLEAIDDYRVGRDFSVLTLSFDSHDTMATAAGFRSELPLPQGWEGGWYHGVLEGETVAERDAQIGAFTSQLGFRYFWSKADDVFLHPNVLIFLTPEGRIARYLYGTAMDAGNIKLALIDANWDRISRSNDVIDFLTGVCYSFNYAEGRYSINYALVVGVGALLFGLSLVALSMLYYRYRNEEYLL